MSAEATPSPRLGSLNSTGPEDAAGVACGAGAAAGFPAAGAAGAGEGADFVAGTGDVAGLAAGGDAAPAPSITIRG